MSLSHDGKLHLTTFNPISSESMITLAPNGWSTVRTWWSVEEGGAFSLLVDPLKTLLEEDGRLQALATAQSIPEVLVGPCPALAAIGVPHERAYPNALLERFYPSQP